MKRKIVYYTVAILSASILFWSCEDSGISGDLIEKTSINCENEFKAIVISKTKEKSRLIVIFFILILYIARYDFYHLYP